jgi:hypothetical protein
VRGFGFRHECAEKNDLAGCPRSRDLRSAKGRRWGLEHGGYASPLLQEGMGLTGNNTIMRSEVTRMDLLFFISSPFIQRSV